MHLAPRLRLRGQLVIVHPWRTTSWNQPTTTVTVWLSLFQLLSLQLPMSLMMVGFPAQARKLQKQVDETQVSL